MTRFQKSLVFVGIGLVLFTASRLVLFLVYRSSFSGLSSGDVVFAFVNGLRFDLNVILAVFVGPLVLMNLPFRRCVGRWFSTWSWLAFATLVPMGLLLGGDLVYFGYVQRHIADELLVMGADFDFVASEGLTTYLPGLLVCLGLIFGVGLGWVFILKRSTRPGRPVLAFLLMVAFCVLGIRGSVDRKPIGLIDAFSSGNNAFGNLSLNGVFSAYHASVNVQAAEHVFYDTPACLAELDLRDTEYPVLRRQPDLRPTGHNVVILLLESWDRRFMDSYDGAGLGLTPWFDALAAGGLRFENFYASSQRSVESIQAILTGVPPLVGLPGLGSGLKLSNITEVGTEARRYGYETLFVQSSKRRSYRLDSAAMSLGFSHVYGQQDVPLRRHYPGPTPKWGWDYDTLMFAQDRMDAFRSPFLAFVFTGSTHSPYPDPGEPFRKRQHAPIGEAGYVNTLHYSDWAVGEFMNAARRKPWFKSTVFILCADHVWRSTPTGDVRDEFRIPFILYGPGIIEAGTVNTVCSHLDCLPTLFDIMGFPDPLATTGMSLIGNRSGQAILKKGSLMGIVWERGALTHSLRNRLETSFSGSRPPPDYFQRMERRLLATVQVTRQLLRANHWAPPTR